MENEIRIFALKIGFFKCPISLYIFINYIIQKTTTKTNIQKFKSTTWNYLCLLEMSFHLVHLVIRFEAIFKLVARMS